MRSVSEGRWSEARARFSLASVLLAGLVLEASACGPAAPEPDAGQAPDAWVAEATDASDALEDAALGEDLVDRDGDGVVDALDAFPDDPSESLDSDGDGVGNVAQLDEDGDGVPDLEDERPLVPTESRVAIVEHRAAPTRVEAGVPVILRGVLLAGGSQRFTFTAGGGAAWTAIGAASSAQARAVVRFGWGEGPRLGLAPSLALAPHASAAALSTPDGGEEVWLEVSGFEGPYEVYVFEDVDTDGAPDEREVALGGRVHLADTDRDGLLDGEELLGAWGQSMALDPDSDRRAALVDDDSDGDGVLDRLEGPSDLDSDGARNALDLDADGDGRADADESGAGPVLLDGDGDGLADAFDLDQDADGLLDVRDDDPSAPLPFRAGLELERVATRMPDGEEVAGLAHGLGTLVLRARGLTEPADTVWVVLRSPGGTIVDVAPSAIDVASGEIELPVGSTPFDAVWLVDGAARTPPRGVRYLPPEAPVLVGTTGPLPTLRGPVTISGYNLERTLAIVSTTPTGDFTATPRSLTVRGLEGAQRVSVQAIVGSMGVVESNRVEVEMRGEAYVTVSLPAGMTISAAELVLEGLPELDATGSTVPIMLGRPHLVVAALPGAPAERSSVVLSRLVTRSGSVRLDARSTAVAMVVGSAVPTERVAADELDRLLTEAERLPELDALESAVAAALVADPRGLDHLEGALAAALVDAHAAFQALLPTTGSAALLGSPEISPEMFDVSVRERSGGNVTVENDTMMYLSARIVDRDTGRVLVPHVSSYADPAMIGTQSGLLTLFWAGSADFDAPRYRNARVEVVTPGLVRGSRALDDAGQSARFFVSIRSFVDKLVLPIVVFAVGRAFPGDVLLNLMAQQLPDALAGARAAYAAGDPRQAWSILLAALRTDVDNVGPMTQALARALFGEGAVTTLARRIATKLLPGLGQLSVLVDAISGAASAINVGKYAVDVYGTPDHLEFDVVWGLGISRVHPQSVGTTEGDTRIEIHGARFDPSREAPLALPEVVFQAADVGELVVRAEAVSSDGTTLWVVLPDDYAARARDEIDVRVRHRGEEARWERSLVVDRSRALRRLEPSWGRPGDRIRLEGYFTGDPRFVTVSFESSTDASDPRRRVVRARVLSVAPREVQIEVPREVGVIPEGAMGEPEWFVFATLGPVGFQRSTISLPFSTLPRGAWVMTMEGPVRPLGGLLELDKYDPRTSGHTRDAWSGLPSDGDRNAWFLSRTGGPEVEQWHVEASSAAFPGGGGSSTFMLEVDHVAGRMTGTWVAPIVPFTARPLEGFLLR